jgi:uncharacterized protein (TIGR02996 family)
MTSDDQALLNAIDAKPQDEAVWLIYADWLEERDDPRGAYIRALVDMVRPSNTVEVFDSADAVIRQIQDSLDVGWREKVWRLREKSELRGLVEMFWHERNRTCLLVRILAGRLQKGERILLPLASGEIVRDKPNLVGIVSESVRGKFPVVLVALKPILKKYIFQIGGIITHARRK